MLHDVPDEALDLIVQHLHCPRSRSRLGEALFVAPTGPITLGCRKPERTYA